MGREGRRGRGPGRAPLEGQRREYVELVARGLSNAEACRRVGVNRRTGTRWRYGRSVPTAAGGELHCAPVIDIQPSVRSARYLSEDERILIADGLHSQLSLRAIGRQLGRSASTISREIARNSPAGGGYRPARAQRLATARFARPKKRR